MAVALDTRDSIRVERQELVCRTCGYGVVVRSEPPPCPMCRGSEWEPRIRRVP